MVVFRIVAYPASKGISPHKYQYYNEFFNVLGDEGKDTSCLLDSTCNSLFQLINKLFYIIIAAYSCLAIVLSQNKLTSNFNY